MSKTRFPLSDIKFHNIPVVGQFYTKQEVNGLIKDAVDEARRIDEESMRKHNSCLLYTSPSPRDH